MRSSAPTGGGSECTQEVVCAGWLSACRGREVVEEKCLDHRMYSTTMTYKGAAFGLYHPLGGHHVVDTG
jgi:hypothetical protein